jgi:multidrug resistance efflux pump
VEQISIMMNIVRRSRFWLLGGLAVLLVCCVSATRAFQGASEKEGEPGAAEPVRSPGVVCLGYIDLEPGVTSLSPLQPGRVTEVLVHENDRVVAGAVLLRLGDTEPRLRVAEARVALEKARGRLEQARKLPAQHQAQLEQQRQATEAAEQRLAAARSLFARKDKLAATRELSAEELAAAAHEVQQLEASVRAERARLTELQLADPAADVHQAELDVRALAIRVEQAEHTVAECALKAPRDGTVLRVLAGPGDVFPRTAALNPEARGQAAIQFALEGRRLVRAEVDQEFASRIQAGQTAVVQDDAPSGISWRGRVLRVADWYTQRRNLAYDATQLRDTRTVECLIALDPGQTEPRLGQRVRVTIGTPRP